MKSKQFHSLNNSNATKNDDISSIKYNTILDSQYFIELMSSLLVAFKLFSKWNRCYFKSPRSPKNQTECIVTLALYGYMSVDM